MAAIELVEKITSAMEDKNYSAGICIDWKKAFDTIVHKILLKKLERYGIRGVAQRWIYYLRNRFQFVQFINERSQLQRVTCEVPQGSVLGPKLFLLYINDICKVLTQLNCVLFADDATLFCSSQNLGQLLDTGSRNYYYYYYYYF